jgi:hypothetical protein
MHSGYLRVLPAWQFGHNATQFDSLLSGSEL